MRVFTAAGLAAAVLAIVSSGCSTSKMPSFIPTFGKKTKPATIDGPQLTNAPPAPTPSTMAGTSPNVSMPASPTQWSNLPMYPGTNYPQTPHTAPAVAQVNHAAPQYAATTPAASPYAAPAATAPQTAHTPYPSGPASAANPYAPPAAPSYAQPQGASYATTAAPAAGQQPAAPAYAQQSPPYTPPANPYAAPANPYAAPANPYAAPPVQQNAANPYASTVTR